MIRLTVTPKGKPAFDVYFKTVQAAKAFAEFQADLVQNVKKKTQETKA